MGIILDTSAVIKAERTGVTASAFLYDMSSLAGEQRVALSAIGYTELVHGLYRGDSDVRRQRRRNFLAAIVAELQVYAYTQEIAEIAGRIDGEQTARGNPIHFPDLLIGATAISLGFSVLTANERHFRLIPGLDVIAF